MSRSFPSLPTVHALILWGTEGLRPQFPQEAALEARLILQYILEKPHEFIVLNPDHVCTTEHAQKYQQWLERRIQGEPISKIAQQREFYSLSFYITQDVLDPRADSEVLIETTLDHMLVDEPFHILDLGVGSGCLLLTLLHHRPLVCGVGVDISPKALKVAQENARRLGVESRVTWNQSPWGADLPEKSFDWVISNPPYVRHKDIAGLSENVRDYDPHLALDGGKDGLDAYRSIAKAAPRLLKPMGFLVLEIGEGQQKAVDEIFETVGFKRIIPWVKDLGNIPRCGLFEFTLR